ncbi:helix-turn-helix transcriptional regulator [Chryseobacterium sp. NRRL B-14859]|uniref:helix-turn-helix domain-containing protein n=1 Tax=unclassified Chryseobacterium TaxID=2593645 RepID=UPI00333FBE80
MIKFKLLEARKRKKFTQEQMANALYMNISNYSRRESGQIKINTNEWQKIAEILDVPLEQIYETDDEFFLSIQKKSETHDCTTSDLCNSQVLTELEHCIGKIEEELGKLKEEVKNLKVPNTG